jgi:hypothetical protein
MTNGDERIMPGIFSLSQFILAWNIHNILYGELTDKMWNFDVIPRALIRFGNLNNNGHNSLITSSCFKK